MSQTTKLLDEFDLTQEELDEILKERSGLVVERRLGGEAGAFELDQGMFATYSRVLTIGDLGSDGRIRVTQLVEFSLPLLGFGLVVSAALRSRLRTSRSVVPIPAWLPPDRLDPVVARQLARVVLISVSAAYFATLLGQTLTFSAHQFHASVKMQAAVLLVSRFDILPGFGLLMLANRFGRAGVIRIATIIGTLFSALSAFSPNMAILALVQLGAKGATAAASVLVAVLVAEMVSRRQRAWAIGTLVIGAALGAGFCDVLLPLAGLSISSWRTLYLIAIPIGIWGTYLSFGVAETDRFARARVSHLGASVSPRWRGTSTSRVWALSVAAFLVNAFMIPTTQFRNEYLRVERHFSATAIGVFVILTNLPGAIGLAMGGRLSETKGRRMVAGAAIVIGGGGLALGFVTSGLELWIWTLLGSTAITAIVPSLGVYQAEIFPTRSRGVGGGIVTMASRIGSLVGVGFVGYFASRLSLGGAVATLFLGMVLLLPALFFWFPETRGMSLEEITTPD